MLVERILLLFNNYLQFLRVLDANIGFSFYWGSGAAFTMGNFPESLCSSLTLDFNLNHARAHASLLGNTAITNDSQNEIDEDDEDYDIEPFDDSNFYTITDALCNVLNSDIDEDLWKSIKPFYDNLPESVYEGDDYKEWRRYKSLSWAKELKTLLNQHCHIDFNWQFSNEQWAALEAYCYANKLLVECLNNCYISHEIRAYLEDSLLLPFEQIQEQAKALLDGTT